MYAQETCKATDNRMPRSTYFILLLFLGLTSCNMHDKICENGNFSSHILSSKIDGSSSILYKKMVIPVLFQRDDYNYIVRESNKSPINYFYVGLSVSSSCRIVEDQGKIELYLFNIKNIEAISDKNFVDKIYRSYGISPVEI